MPLYSVLILLTQIVKVVLLASLLCNSFTQLELVFPILASVDVVFTVEMCPVHWITFYSTSQADHGLGAYIVLFSKPVLQSACTSTCTHACLHH